MLSANGIGRDSNYYYSNNIKFKGKKNPYIGEDKSNNNQ